MREPVLDPADLATAIADEALNDEFLNDEWDSWAAHWETEFSRLNKLEEQWKKQGAERACMEMKREAQYRQAEENAARARQPEQQVEDLRRQAEKEKLRDDATQQRKQ